MKLLAIDPGNIQSAFVIVDENLKPIEFGKIDNDKLLYKIGNDEEFEQCDMCAIEMIESYGMSVGKEVFDTCVWIGRFTQAMLCDIPVEYIYRKEEKITICGSLKAKDSNIRQGLIDLFAQFDFKNGKGTKANPDWFFGFKSDIWASYAVAYTAKMKLEGKQ